jgi:hypothetical protein
VPRARPAEEIFSTAIDYRSDLFLSSARLDEMPRDRQFLRGRLGPPLTDSLAMTSEP